MEITIQSFEFPGQGCKERELYYRVSEGRSGQESPGSAQRHTYGRETGSDLSGSVSDNGAHLRLNDGMRITSDAYMNLFDLDFWSSCTGITQFSASVIVCGSGVIRLKKMSSDGNDPVLDLRQGDWKEPERILFPIQAGYRAGQEKSGNGILYLEWEASQGGTLTAKDIRYLAEAEPDRLRKVHLSLIICTYHREQELNRNLKQLKESRFFDEKDELFGKISARIVDNAGDSQTPGNRKAPAYPADPFRSEQINCGCLPLIRRYPNPNTGGSGGFLRGMQETRQDEKKYGITHVLLMDDDVEFRMESLYRLYAFLCLAKPKYAARTVAGRMFRTDRRNIQFTACEIWNNGLIRHEGGDLDMKERRNLYGVNRMSGEYTGWWFACFPMEYVRENLPFPFFLHCDDVEYGLRKGDRPVVLNGIQVWHETADYRQSPLIAYYDMRNMAIVNTLIGIRQLKKTLLRVWDRNLLASLRSRDGNRLAMQLCGIRDYIWWERTGEWPDGQAKHKEIRAELEMIAGFSAGAKFRYRFRALLFYLRLRLPGQLIAGSNRFYKRESGGAGQPHSSVTDETPGRKAHDIR